MNRVEGDLEVHAELRDDLVVRAWCSGTLYRGFETLMVGRGSLDGLVITPRICGICSTSHLHAAALALDQIHHARVPAEGQRVRNVALMAEHLQSDLRQHALMFCPDMLHPSYADTALYDAAVERYAPNAGRVTLEVVRRTRRLLDIIAILGGQWPHSNFMVPGGVVCLPTQADLQQCRLLLAEYRRWYEAQVLGCSIERWHQLRGVDELDAWLAERPEHASSEVGFLLRWGAAHDWAELGAHDCSLISYGSLVLPGGSQVRGRKRSSVLMTGGVASNGHVRPLVQAEISEHIACSWFQGYEGGRHPSRGVTMPYATGLEGDRYSWAKAPRYQDRPAETGALAELVVGGHPLLQDMVASRGSTVLARQLARLVRGAELLPAMQTWLEEIDPGGEFYRSPDPYDGGEGVGLTQASRGALGHWVRIEDDRIAHYQIITPTAWNASPRDANGVPGPMETALAGTRLPAPDAPVQLGHVVRSFDPCLVCTVHTLQPSGATRRLRLGVG